MRKEYVYVDDLDGTRSLLIDSLGFRELPADIPLSATLVSPSGTLQLVLRQGPGTGSGFANRSRVVIGTEDCLRDFYRLRNDRVRFLNDPHYRADGLAVNFTDRSGNIYTLLEERVYETSE